MTREEYNLFRRIRADARRFGMPTYGCQYTIPTDGSPDFKQRLHALYESWGLHPASVRVDRHWFDDRERIIYIYGRTWEDRDGSLQSWERLYSEEERARFSAALQ